MWNKNGYNLFQGLWKYTRVYENGIKKTRIKSIETTRMVYNLFQGLWNKAGYQQFRGTGNIPVLQPV